MGWILDIFTSTKNAQILDGVTKLASWAMGLDRRLNEIERRMGSIEFAFTQQGVRLIDPRGQMVNPSGTDAKEEKK